MAKKKAAVKKTVRKVGGRKKRGNKTLTGFLAFPPESSAYVEFGVATKTQVQETEKFIYTFKAIAKKCDGTAVNIRCFDFAATIYGRQPYLMNIMPSSESESEAEVQFGFDFRPIPDVGDIPTRPLEGELIVTVLTKKTVRVGP